MAGNNNNKNNEYVHTCRTVTINCHTKVLGSTKVLVLGSKAEARENYQS